MATAQDTRSIAVQQGFTISRQGGTTIIFDIFSFQLLVDFGINDIDFKFRH